MKRFRKPLRQHARPKADPVTPDMRERVLRRDGACVAAVLESRGMVDTRDHVCRDQWGAEHDPRALGRLTLEHVKDDLAMSMRAPSDERHLVACCYGLNVGVPSKTWRAAFRAYLRSVPPSEEPHAAHVDPVAGCEPCYQASRP